MIRQAAAVSAAAALKGGSTTTMMMNNRHTRAMALSMLLRHQQRAGLNTSVSNRAVASLVETMQHHQQRVQPSSSHNRYKSTAAAVDEVEENTTIPPPPPKKAEQEQPPPASSNRKYKYFQDVQVTPSGIAIIKFDGPKPVNTLCFDMKDEAQTLWNAEIHSNNDIKGVVFLSGKPDGFIAGADIMDIKNIDNKEELKPIIENMLSFFQHMKSKNIPLVCGIHGPALGGGLEWALWCDYRICTDSTKTKMGLPEVKLGLLPGFGGTQNLHPLVGTQKALDMMLTGKDIRPDRARKMGLVDEVVALPSLESRAINVALGLADGTLKKKGGKKKKSWMDWFVEDTPVGNNMMWKKTKEMVDKNTAGKYPAPYAILDCVKNGIENPKTKYEYERNEFAKLAATPESEALIGIFDGMQQMKKHAYGEATHPVNTVAVLGAGLMGAGIAQITAEKGYTVLLKDRDDAGVSKGEQYIDDNWSKKLKRKRMSQYQYNINQSNIIPLTDQSQSWMKHFANADLIIEAVFEDINLKRKIVSHMEEVTPDHCVFASNTSALPIASIAEGARRPENIVGMHYFSPVPSMPLLEIIPHGGTSDQTMASACALGTKQGKTVVVVKDVPGFYVNRCLGPFLVEVSALVRDGVSLEKLDKSMKNFGMPVGPITLADEVGIDITSHVANFLSKADLGVRMDGGNVSLMENMIEKGWLGKKSGQGFYTYKGKGGKDKSINSEVKSYVQGFVEQDLGLKEEEIQNRMVSRFVNEAAKCLEDEIISDPVAGDIGLVFGTGFAPFRGGPFRYLDQIGTDTFVGTMNDFADKYGPQFEPCDLLKDYAASGKKFHK